MSNTAVILNNPFIGSNVSQLQIEDIASKVVIQTVPQNFLTPGHVPTSNQQYHMSNAAIANTLTELQNVQTFIAGSSYDNFVPIQQMALANTINVFMTLSSNATTGNVALTPSQINDAIITYLAIFNLTLPGNQIVTSMAPPVQITAPAFPNGAKTLTVNDGFFIVEQANTGNFFVSENQDGSQWDADSSGVMESFSDTIVAVDSYSGMLCLMGLQSIEFWIDQGLTPLPYQRINGAQQNWGLAARFGRAHFLNSIAFLGQDQVGMVQVLLIQGYVPTQISNDDIESIINSFPVINDCVMLSYDLNGHQMLQLNFPTANRSFLYDGTVQIWSEIQSGTAEYSRHLSGLGVAFNYSNYMSDYQSGNIYLLSPDVFTDNGFLIKRELITKHLNLGGNSFTVAEIWLDFDLGDGTQTGLGQNPKISMSFSKDNGKTWSKERFKSVGKVGQYQGPRVTWRMVGSARDMVFRFRMTDPVPFSIAQISAVIIEGRGN
jgi:Phage stabilisation protein